MVDPKTRSFEDGFDFIPFDFSDEGLEVRSPVSQPITCRREKRRRREASYDSDDRTASRKQRFFPHSLKYPWISGLHWGRCHHVAQILHREVEAFTNWISPTPIEKEIRQLVVAIITKAVTMAFPDASVIPFGSYETKLYLPLGDIDLVVLSNSMAYSNKVHVMQVLANTLKRAGITKRVTIIARAKVPIVKFVTVHGHYNIDISINQQSGVLSGQIINGFLRSMHLDPSGKGSLALRSLIMITKLFLSQRNMNEVYTGGLGSYSIVCLAISFLQMHPKIRRGEIDTEKNLGVLLLEFFELYGCYFNYDEVGISLRDGGTYFSKKQRGWYEYGKSGLLSIEDPADSSNDISRSSYGFQKVRASLAGAHGILVSTTFLRAGILSSRKEGRSIRFRDNDRLEDMSILSSFLGVSQETINHRKLVQDLYNQRILHDILGVSSLPVVVDSIDIVPTANRLEEQPFLKSRLTNSESVHLAWKEADDIDIPQKRRRRSPISDSGDTGRYDKNGGPPPAKRRKSTRVSDTRTIFITDDEDEVVSRRTRSLGSDAEDTHYASDIDPSSANYDDKQEQRNGRRSFWLSKGIGISAET